MKSLYKPLVAALSLVAWLGGASCLAQGLPPTNMGKFVHQPGDNQYSNQTQLERHAAPPAPQAMAPGGGQGMPMNTGWQPTPPPPKADISLLPIVTDEPTPQAGFPPIPDKLDLPIQTAWGGSMTGGMGGPGGGPGGPGGYGGQRGGPAGPPQPTMHPGGYSHLPAGAYAPQQSPGYYKATTPGAPPAGGGDYYSSSAGGVVNPAAAGQQALRSLGREPKFNDSMDKPTAPEAPTAVVVNQARTQDLSIPEDDYNQQRKQNNNSMGNQMKRQMGNSLMRPLMYAPQMMMGMGMGMGMSAIHY